MTTTLSVASAGAVPHPASCATPSTLLRTAVDLLRDPAVIRIHQPTPRTAMNTLLSAARPFAVLLILALSFVAGPQNAFAHCDTMNGPVVLDAKKALETGDLEPVLKWVTPADEAEVRAAFTRTMNVRSTGAEARELADLYFFETVVRLHRMSEGVGYTGLKPAATVAPAVAAADHALETGSVEALAALLTHDLHAALAERFADAYEAKAHASHSVEAGRAFVAAYVRFTHLAEAIEAVTKHAAGTDTGEHAGRQGAAGSVHAH